MIQVGSIPGVMGLRPLDDISQHFSACPNRDPVADGGVTIAVCLLTRADYDDSGLPASKNRCHEKRTFICHFNT